MFSQWQDLPTREKATKPNSCLTVISWFPSFPLAAIKSELKVVVIRETEKQLKPEMVHLPQLVSTINKCLV